MENIIIAESEQPYIPYVNFNADTGKCVISGESYLDDAFQFYESLATWIKKYFESGKKELTLRLELSYFNTSTASAMIIFFEFMKSYQDQGKQLTIEWIYSDSDIKEEGEAFIMDTDILMNVVKK